MRGLSGYGKEPPLSCIRSSLNPLAGVIGKPVRQAEDAQNADAQSSFPGTQRGTTQKAYAADEGTSAEGQHLNTDGAESAEEQ